MTFEGGFCLSKHLKSSRRKYVKWDFGLHILEKGDEEQMEMTGEGCVVHG